ncbi:hypothetical protein GCM10029978_067270 [Actinoallomurus acanthiterrae]
MRIVAAYTVELEAAPTNDPWVSDRWDHHERWAISRRALFDLIYQDTRRQNPAWTDERALLAANQTLDAGLVGHRSGLINRQMP